MRNRFSVACALGILLSLSACDGGPAAFPQEGQYSGFYGGEEVTAILKQVSSTELTLTFDSQTWTFDGQDSGGITLRNAAGTETFSPPSSPGSSGDSSGNLGGCYSAKAGDNTLELCFSAEEIHWAEVGPDGSQLASLDLTRLLNGELPPLETPERYALNELVTRAKTRNFQSVVEFKKMVLAKDNALNADLNLLPHVNATDVLNILSGSLYTELKSIGDLVPFLLPDRWYRVAAANDMAAADKDSWEIMDVDGVNYVESFAYASARDEEALASMASERTMVASLRDFIRGKEQAGLVQVGTSDDLSAMVNKIDLSSSDLRTLQTNELSALSQAAGFYNPGAIIGVDFKPDPSAPTAAKPITVDFDSSARIATSHAAELRQMDDLLAWAQNEARAEIFDWMDPSGDANGGVGLGLPSYIEAGQDEVAVIQAQTELVKSDLLNNLQTAIEQLRSTEADYQLAVQGVDIQQRRVERETENLKVGVGFVMSDLLDALQDQVNSQLAQIDAEYGYQLALSRFNRILYQGNYAVTGVQADAVTGTDASQ